ncbi:MAG: glycosyltransferase family 2 protein [Neomegalonema sp.]|nr:glycosyltransferase family 2 protein [Neomegalonema sp.]
MSDIANSLLGSVSSMLRRRQAGDGFAALTGAEDVRALYRVILGRECAPTDIAEKGQQPLGVVARAMFGSQEFAERIWPSLSEGGDLLHEKRLDGQAFAQTQAWMAQRLSGHAPHNWRQALGALGAAHPELGAAIAGVPVEKAVQILTAARDDRPVEKPVEPTLSEEEIALCDQAGGLFALILGRKPEAELDLLSRAKRPWQDEIRELLCSDEFSHNVIDRLIEGRKLPHQGLSSVPDPVLLGRAADRVEGALPLRGLPLESWPLLIGSMLELAPLRALIEEGAAEDPERLGAEKARLEAAIANATGRVQAVRILRAQIVERQSLEISVSAIPPQMAPLAVSLHTDLDGAALAQTEINWPELAEAPVASSEREDAGAEPLQTEVTLALSPFETVPERLFVRAAIGSNAALPLVVQTSLPGAEREAVLARIAHLLVRDERQRAQSELTALQRRLPFDAEIAALRIEEAFWAGENDRAQSLFEQWQGAGAAIARVAARRAADQRDWPRAASLLQTLLDTSAMERALLGSGAAPTLVAPLLDGAPSAAPSGLARALGREDLDNNAAAIEAMITLFVPPARIAVWIEHLPRAHKGALLQYLARSGSPAAQPIFSHLAPRKDLPCLMQLGIARFASDDGRPDVAMAWIETAMAGKLTRDQKIRAAYTARHTRSFAGQALASDLFAQVNAKSPARNIEELVARLEIDLCKRDPLRDRKRGAQASSRLRELCVRELERDPTDPEKRHRLAKALILQGQLSEGISILESLHEIDPDKRSVLLDLIQTRAQVSEPETLISLCERYLAGGYDDRVAIHYIRALRAEDTAEKVAPFIEAHWEETSGAIRGEYARNFFFVGEFDTALSKAEALLEADPDNRMARTVAIAATIELGQPDRAAEHLRFFDPGDDEVVFLEQQLFRYAMAYGAEDKRGCLEHLNTLFARYGCQPITTFPGQKLSFDTLKPSGMSVPANDIIGPAPVYDGPLVSVVMTAYNAEDYIYTSIRSLLDQSYRNLEIIVVDDLSTDSTPDLLREIERDEPRVRALLKTTNDGTYVSKNMGILQARGQYIALQDSDDWSHPDRIAKSVAALEAYPELVGVTTDWLRMDSDGKIVIKAGGQISHTCCISLVFRKAEALSRAGLYDSVRIEADMEYILRLRLLYGEDAVARLRWPLLLGRAHSASLTASEEYGITRTGFTEPRRLYQASYKAWHKRIAEGSADGAMPFPMRERPYVAPGLMLPERIKEAES